MRVAVKDKVWGEKFCFFSFFCGKTKYEIEIIKKFIGRRGPRGLVKIIIA